MVDNTGSKISPFGCAQRYCLKIEIEDTSQTFIKQYVLRILAIGHLHDGVILLLLPESFSFFLSYLNLVIPVRVKQQKSQFAQESKTLKDSGRSSKNDVIVQMPYSLCSSVLVRNSVISTSDSQQRHFFSSLLTKQSRS